MTGFEDDTRVFLYISVHQTLYISVALPTENFPVQCTYGYLSPRVKYSQKL